MAMQGIQGVQGLQHQHQPQQAPQQQIQPQQQLPPPQGGVPMAVGAPQQQAGHAQVIAADPAVAHMQAAEARRYGKRELSTSKRAAQNRAAQVSYCYCFFFFSAIRDFIC